MKRDQFSAASKLLAQLGEQEVWLSAVKTGAIEINFGGYSFAVVKSIQDELRAKITTQLEGDIAKTQAALTELGVEL
jgi:hypothetical protein